MPKNQIRSLFPLLNNDFEITSNPTPSYNCIAWAADNDSLWWWPDSMGQCYWPDYAPREETIDAFIIAYEGLGYRVCNNGDFKNGFTNIAIFASDFGEPRHASRQLANGKWTSKLGKGHDISHEIGGVSGKQYGSIKVFMKKKNQ